MLYVATRTQASLCGTSLEPAVNLVMRSFGMSVHMQNWLYHCSTDTDELHSTRQERLIVHAATMPTSVLPAPQGSTMMPERARWFENIRLRERSW